MSTEELRGGQPHLASPIGIVMANISRRIVGLYKEFSGKGPTRARTYLQDDVVLVLLSGGYTRVEETLLREGRGDVVMLQRHELQEVMRDHFIEVIESELGRKVLAFMSANHHSPDLMGELFLLEPSVAPGDSNGSPHAAGGPPAA